MISTSVLSTAAGLMLLTSVTSALPQHPGQSKRQSSSKTVVYWGRGAGDDIEKYCAPEAGVDILVLSFLNTFGDGITIPTGNFGESCTINTAGEGQSCDALSSSISHCQEAGVEVILSLGGGASMDYTLSSHDEAVSIGQYLWQSYGNGGAYTDGVPRPFGSVSVDGFDLDIEYHTESSQEYYISLISTLRTVFDSDPDKKYRVSGAPVCPIPDPSMGEIIQNAEFDYIWPQFYNSNYGNACALPVNGNPPFNYDEWIDFTNGTPSSEAEFFIGVPASEKAATGDQSGAHYYATPDELAGIVGEYKSHERFAGVMMWSSDWSEDNIVNGCTYAQNVHSILSTGSPC